MNEEEEEDKENKRTRPGHLRPNVTRFVLSQSSYGRKANSKPTALLVSFGEIMKPVQQFTEDKCD